MKHDYIDPKVLVHTKITFFAFAGPNQEGMPLGTSNTSPYMYVPSGVLIG